MMVNFTYHILLIFPLLILISVINQLSIKLQLFCDGKAMIYVFGIVGVPIHELSHYLFCLVFKHKVSKIVLFKPNFETGQLGYVSHSYNMNNKYQSIGQIFISFAPMIIGTFLISFISNLFNITSLGLNSLISNPLLILKYITYVYIFMSISSYMIWSFQDIKNCKSGIIYTFICISICIILFPNVFILCYNGLLVVLKYTLINFILSFVMFLISSCFK